MTGKLNWLLALLVVTMLVAACGPDMVTPTPGAEPEGVDTQPTQPAGESSEEAGLSAGELAVDENDWRALGSADAPVTMIEYSDFQ